MYPLWLCPFKLPNDPGFVHPKTDEEEMYVDIGAYGRPTVGNFDAKETTRRIERFVSQHNGCVLFLFLYKI